MKFLYRGEAITLILKCLVFITEITNSNCIRNLVLRLSGSLQLQLCTV